MIGAPILIDGAPTAAERPSPRLGEHTEEKLREIGEA
jgi:crotonobetainyl-CoA:carnitine CoA-transferase CaiB-like acyl-CoA transferase